MKGTGPWGLLTLTLISTQRDATFKNLKWSQPSLVANAHQVPSYFFGEECADGRQRCVLGFLRACGSCLPWCCLLGFLALLGPSGCDFWVARVTPVGAVLLV